MGAECFVDRLLFTKNVRVNVCVVFKNYVLKMILFSLSLSLFICLSFFFLTNFLEKLMFS